MKRCEECGGRCYEHGCFHCNEESYILDQHVELGTDGELSQDFLDKVHEQKERELKRRRIHATA